MRIMIDTNILILALIYKRERMNKLWPLDALRSQISYAFVYTPKVPKMVEDIDLFITGDKDFMDIKLAWPKIMSPTQFLALPPASPSSR